jgi:DNA-binding NarL/FixJ family response regulator
MIATEDAEDEVRSAYDTTRSSRAFDGFIFVSRLHQRILSILADDEDLRDELDHVLRRADRARHSESSGPVSSQGNSLHGPLTKREDEVYSLLAEGRSNREIATALFISEPTVKVHVRNILRKLGARSRTEVAIQAARKQQPQAPGEEDPPRGS